MLTDYYFSKNTCILGSSNIIKLIINTAINFSFVGNIYWIFGWKWEEAALTAAMACRLRDTLASSEDDCMLPTCFTRQRFNQGGFTSSTNSNWWIDFRCVSSDLQVKVFIVVDKVAFDQLVVEKRRIFDVINVCNCNCADVLYYIKRKEFNKIFSCTNTRHG